MSKSYLDSAICSDDSSVSLDGYNLICADHPKNIKQRGVWVHYREILLVKTVQTNDLPECLVCEVNYENKKKIVTLYWCSRQNDDEFDEFLCSFESAIAITNQSKPYFVLTGDFNACSQQLVGNQH